MNAPNDKAPFAWQPLTVRGVAAFARAPLGRVLVVQLIVALVAAGMLVWFLHRAWFPTITQAIQALPPTGDIRAGRLEWAGQSPCVLAEGRYLAIAVDLDHTGEARSPAHVQVELGRSDVRLSSVLGSRAIPYPREDAIAFNRNDLVPWWGAWAPAILTLAAGGLMLWLMTTWACLATLYTLPVWLIGLFADRDCTLSASWRLAGAALMPGALFMSAGIGLYGWGALDLARLVVIGALHLPVAWVYLVASPFCLARRAPAQLKGNPFA